MYAAANSPKVLAKVYDAGHGVFGDHCLYGDDGRRWVDLMGSWEVFPPQLVEFAGDGCGRDLPSVAEAQPAIGHALVAFLRWSLGIDGEPVALDTQTLGKLGTPVTVTRD